MNHDEIRQSLHEFSGGELAGEARREVEGHLASCADCRRELREWERISRALFRAPSVQASETFVSGVMRRMEREAPPADRVPSRWLAPALAMAAGLLFLVMSAPDPEDGLAAEDFLLANGQTETRYRWFFMSDHSEPDDVLNYVMEES